MVGILSFEKGDILIDGKSIKQNPIACKYEIAYIPDDPNIYENLTGINILILYTISTKFPKRKETMISKNTRNYFCLKNSAT